MAMALPRPSTAGTRPAYLDGLFIRDMPKSSSVHTSTSSISSSSTASNCDLRSAYHASRPLSPPIEEDNSDSFSTRSKKSFLSRRRFRLGTVLHRRTYPQADDLDFQRPMTTKAVSHSTPPSPPASTISDSLSSSRRPSLPRLQTNFPPPEAISHYAKKALPAVPTQPKPRPEVKRQKSNTSTSEASLSCQRCYYFAARNCQGYVLGGEAGDPCESCLQSGYFGAK